MTGLPKLLQVVLAAQGCSSEKPTFSCSVALVQERTCCWGSSTTPENWCSASVGFRLWKVTREAWPDFRRSVSASKVYSSTGGRSGGCELGQGRGQKRKRRKAPSVGVRIQHLLGFLIISVRRDRYYYKAQMQQRGGEHSVLSCNLAKHHKATSNYW